jgi:hypothetical protein
MKIVKLTASRKHIYNDLKPYTCVFSDCSLKYGLFPDRNTWADHIGLEHQLAPAWHALECSLCHGTVDEGKYSIILHLGKHLEEISLAALPQDISPDEDPETSSGKSDLLLNSPAYQSSMNSFSGRLKKRHYFHVPMTIFKKFEPKPPPDL